MDSTHWTGPETQCVGGYREHRITSRGIVSVWACRYSRKWCLSEWICWLMFGE